jgi:hypothetical protein
MSKADKYFPGSRKVVLLWATLWMLVVPLAHIHPEQHHQHHGEAEHVHHGIVHTIFSQDHDGIGHHTHDHSVRVAIGKGSTLSADSTHGDQESPEFEFSLLSDSTDRKLPKPLSTHIAFVNVGSARVLSPSYLAEHDSRSAFVPILVIVDRPSRAPPAFLV